MLINKKSLIFMVLMAALLSNLSHAKCVNVDVGDYSTTLCFEEVLNSKKLDKLTAQITEDIDSKVDELSSNEIFWNIKLNSYINNNVLKQFIRSIIVFAADRYFKKDLEMGVRDDLNAFYLKQALDEVQKQNPNITIDRYQTEVAMSADLLDGLHIFVKTQSRDLVEKAIKTWRKG